MSKTVSRRGLFGTAAAVGASLGLGPFIQGCGGSSHSTTNDVSVSHPNLADYIIYILNLEYLEAEYFSRGVTGSGIGTNLAGAGAGTVTGGSQVTFTTPGTSTLMTQIQQQELSHVSGLRSQLFSAIISEPTINLTAGFLAVGEASGFGSGFDPFSSESNFLLGAFFLEDLVASAYAGEIFQASIFGGFCAAEVGHSTAIRSLIYQAGTTLISDANQIAAARATFTTVGEPLTSGQNVYLAPIGAGGTVDSAIPAKVLNAVYQSSNGTKGAFFPKGLTGFIR